MEMESVSNHHHGDDHSDNTSDWSDEGDNSATTHENIPQNKDIKMINIIRSFVILLMLTIAMITANSVFVFQFILEENQYEAGLQDYSKKLIDNFYAELERKINMARTLSTTFTSQSHSTGATWPFVAFPEFGAQCAVPRQVGQVSAVSFTPLVNQSQRAAWERYANYMSFVATQDKSLEKDPLEGEEEENATKFIRHHNRSITDGIYRIVEGNAVNDTTTTDVYFPVWQSTPLTSNATEIMFHYRSNPLREQGLFAMLQSSAGACSDVLLHNYQHSDIAYYTTPRGELYYPLWETLQRNDIVGALGLEFRWETFMTGVLEHTDVTDPLVVVLESSCGGNYTFEVTSQGALFVGKGELYDATVESSGEIQSSDYDEFAKRMQGPQSTSEPTTSISCDFRISIYPSKEFRDSYLTNAPLYLKLLVAGVFVFTISVFVVYDCIVDSYQKRMVESAEKTHAIVRALFPQNVRDRLLRFNEQKSNIGSSRHDSVAKDNWTLASGGSRVHQSPKFRLKNMLNQPTPSMAGSQEGDEESNGMLQDEPLADLYPEATILFSDIAGFTAWSSEREPAQVFTLLETLYGAMDKIAKRLGVFKVETIGDCYVAATGLPNAKKDHAEVMVRFARATMLKNRQLLVSLEAQLGPGTAELGMRTGIHSGAVTAGILRGEKSRFQLFGDTMNTASRIESTGQKHKIQLSEDVFKYLEAAGKAHWVIPREGGVKAKGKGELQTYWLKLGGDSVSSDSTGIGDEPSGDDMKSTSRRHSLVGNKILDPILWKTETNSTDERLVDWNTDVLMSLLTNVVASRTDDHAVEQAIQPIQSRDIPIKEIASVIHMPTFSMIEEERKVQLTEAIRNELRDYVDAIASAYQRNAFHSFEHASHVALSASKLLKRIDCADSEEGITIEELYEHTYGIASDALTKFAVVFAALIHDVGHTGVSNGQLAIESPDVAERYENKCIAEQRSLDAAWELLMLPRFANLRSSMFGNQLAEEQRFRQLLVNCVLATDLFDKDLSAKRKERWGKAFNAGLNASGSTLFLTPEDIDCRATVVIEHIIQASDLSHTMQHWHIYRKWNGRLFQEMYAAYQAGRLEKDPSNGWYQGELWFFDNVVIPLALNLKECGVFGASGDEYHTYAVRNREEWASRGEAECDHYLQQLKGDSERAPGYASHVM